jgi:hypothetical protein
LIGGPPDGNGLWVLPVPGGQPRRVGNLKAGDAAWTPDGTAIFTHGRVFSGLTATEASRAKF